MSAWQWVVLGATLAVLGGLFFYEIIRPLVSLRRAIARLATGDFRPVLLKTRVGMFRETSQHVRNLAEMLKQLDRQVVDEGFSLRAILSSMVEGVLIVDRAQRLRLANDALGRMFRFSHSPVNRTIIEVFRNHRLQEAITQTLESAVPRRLEIALDAPGPAGGYHRRNFEVYASALDPKGVGHAVGAVVVFHDISAVKELEAVRREFVANVSHEFRTPLAIINGYIETLLDGALEDREMTEKSLRIMHKNGERLALLIEDLLTISRLEHRTEQLDFRIMDLRETFARTVERLEPTITARKAHISTQWQADARTIEGDSRRIDQIFANLLENALRYGPSESPSVRVTAERQGDHILLRFTDNGPGIPTEDRPHIFERFYRVHKDRSRIAGGTGLGLSIVKHIAQAHGGSVTLDETVPHGASFVVTLPVTQAHTGQ